jgi:cell division ATPase FtsA
VSKFVAIDVGRDACRFLLAEVERGKVQVLRDGMVRVADSPGDGPPHEQLGQLLAGQLDQAHGAGASAIVSICRADIEIQTFDLPPATDAEMASLVEIQFLGETAAVNEQPVIDFVPRKGNPTEPRQVEAIVATPKTIARYEALCAKAGVKLRRLIVRPYATARLTAPVVGHQQNGASLLVSILEDEVDLVVTDADEVFYWRTVQIAGPGGADQKESDRVEQGQSLGQKESSASELQPAAAANGPVALAAEIARTLVVASSHLPEGKRLEQVVLFGLEGGLAGSVANALKQSAGHVRVVDPRTLPRIETGGEESLRSPEFSTALLAMLIEEAEGTTPTVDLLHPRKSPAPPNRRRTALLAVAALVLIVLVGGEWISSLQTERENKLLAIKSKVAEMRKDGKKLAAKVAVVRSIAAWNKSGIIWLDELRDLSIHFPPARDITVRGMTFNPLRQSGARIRVNGLVSYPSVVVRMDHDLRDRYRDATSTDYEETSASGQNWRFDTEITTARRSPKAYAESMAMSASGLNMPVSTPEPPPSTEPATPSATAAGPVEIQQEKPVEGSPKAE